MDANLIEKEALSLPAADRAQLAQRLLLSLDAPAASAREIEESWLLEAFRRAGQLVRGEVQPVPADEVRQKVRAILR